MKPTFNYIRNRIREHSKEDLLNQCYNLLDKEKDEIMPRWSVFLLIKWTHIYGGYKRPSKELTQQKFNKIINGIFHLPEEHIISFIKKHKITESFIILHAQQFYLQTTVYSRKFSMHLKMLHTLKSRYDINKSFFDKTGLSILEFFLLMQALWIYCNANEIEKINLNFYGYINSDFLQIGALITSKEQTLRFLSILTFDPTMSSDDLIELSTKITGIKEGSIQPLERTIFTLYPLQLYNGRTRLIDQSVLNYTANYYIYDFMKLEDERFTTEFGHRFEKYIDFGLREIETNYIPETELKKKLPKHSKLVDFILPTDNIFIECKAVEIRSRTAINPTDALLYSTLKDSILKAYFEQLLNVTRQINPKGENWGIILTYKEIMVSHFPQLYHLGEGNFENWGNVDHLPPENVFIIDVATWDKIISIIKSGQATLLELLQNGRKMNSDKHTAKQSFYMFLDEFELGNLDNLSYLQVEHDLLQF